MEDAGENIDVQLSAQKVRFDFGRAALTSKVIDGSFPDYTRVIPRENNRVMTVDNALIRRSRRPRRHDLIGEEPFGEAQRRNRPRRAHRA